MAQIRSRFFSPKYDSRRIDRDIEQHQRAFGTYIEWYFFDPVNSTFDDVYGEGQDLAGTGRRWRGPVPIPVLSANRREGQKSTTDDGQYVLDTIDVRMSYEQARRAGLLPEMSHNNELHVRDRFVYDNIVWGIRDISVTGQFEPSGHDTMMRVLGVMLRPDEMVNDPDFSRYSASSEESTVTAQMNIVIQPGATFDLPLSWTDANGVNVPLLGVYYAVMRIGVNYVDPAIMTITSNGVPPNDPSITLAVSRDIDVRIPATLTPVFQPYFGTDLVWDLKLTNLVDPTDVVRLVKGLACVDPQVP
jgi:hypothetical protein